MKLREYVLMNSLGALIAVLFTFMMFRPEIEAFALPVIKNVSLTYTERRPDEVVVLLEFTKAREARGIVNSWTVIDQTGTVPGVFFVTPDDCAGEPLRSGATPAGQRLSRRLCVDIPRSLRERPLQIDGIIIYQTDWRLTVPARLPSLFVPDA